MAATAVLASQAATATSPTVVSSPDQTLQVVVSIEAGGVPAYRVERRGKPLVETSRLGLEPALLADFVLAGETRDSVQAAWDNPLGERRQTPDAYSELRWTLQHATGVRLVLEVRAYNEGVAFRLGVPADARDEVTCDGERSEFRFIPGVLGYEEHGTEGEYRRVALTEVTPSCERPLTLELPDGTYAALAEAANHAYARTLFSPTTDPPGGLVTALGGATSNSAAANQPLDPHVTLRPGESTSWRVLIIGDRPGDLLERNYLLLNLNPPSTVADATWIKPGKVMRETTLTTANAKAVIDFAPTAGLSYVHFDAGWYGPEFRGDSDATAVEAKRAAALDLHEVIRYGRERGIGVLVYVNDVAMKRQRDVLLPLYREWGLAGVKLGFVKVGSQAATAWTTETIRLAAENGLLLNIHDGYRATGNNRTYPNLMTVEGIRGNEHMPTAAHNCTLPFTRYVAGIGDYTPCYYSDRIQTTHAHQLAMHVISFSPLQWVFWYDRPEMYRGEPEIEFIREVPTVWDETRVLHGAIGEYATIARRRGAAWFIGTINGKAARTLTIPLDFLPANQTFVASIYDDDDQVTTRTGVRIERRAVGPADVVEAALKPAGGQAIWIRPVTN